MRRAALLVVLAACGKDAAPSKVEPLPPTVAPIDLGRPPIVNPLNLWDLMIDGADELDVVGVIDGAPVTTKDVDDHTGQVLTRIGDRIYDARDAAWRWIVEREGLARAAAPGTIDALLTDQIDRLPVPDDAALDPYLRRDDVAALAGADARAAAVTLWRWDAWRIRRSVLVQRGLDGVTVNRRQLLLIKRELTLPGAGIAEIGDRVITQQELHLAAGYDEQLARQEYATAAKLAFDEIVAERLLAGAPLPEVPAPTEVEIDAYISEHAEYLTATNGRGRAREDLRTLRAVAARDARVAELAASRGVTFRLRESPLEPIAPDVDAPRVAGDPAATHTLEILHCVGTATCSMGTKLAEILVDELGASVRIELGDYFEQPRLATVRGALAMRCAEEQGKGWALAVALSGDQPTVALADLDLRASEVGVAVPAFQACVASDRWLPTIFENVTRANLIGMEMNVLGIWIDGVRVEHLTDPSAAVAQVRDLLQQ